MDLSRRLRPMERRASLMFLLASAVGGFTFGWLALLPILPGLALFWLLQSRLDRFRRPELILLFCLAVIEVGMAASMAMAHGPRIYLLPVFIVPAVLASVAFPVRVAVVVVILTGQLMLAVALGFDLGAVRAMPFALLYPMAVMTAGAGVAMVVAGLDKATRGSAILDPLTGLPNRVALRGRVAELEHQSRINGRPVALIVGDPDRFKAINDQHGHAVGDQVLTQVAARIGSTLAGDSDAYRLGGEEFVVLVSDADALRGAEVAERLRRAIGTCAIEGLEVQMSFGVAASAHGRAFSFGRLFGLADAALYDAKGAGGNRVVVRRDSGSIEATPEQYVLDEVGVDAGLDSSERKSDDPAAHMGDRHRHSAGAAETEADAGGTNLADRWERWNAREHAATGNWLVRDDLQRTQLLELNRRLRDKAKPGFAISFTIGGLAAIQYGWQIVVPPLVMAVVYVPTEHRMPRIAHPEFALGMCWIGLQVSLMMSGLLADKQMLFAWPLLLMLVIGNAAVFPPRGVAIGVALTAGVMFVVGFVENPHLILSAPGTLAFALATLVSMGMLGTTVGRSTIAYRDLAVVDPLTGLLNRAALSSRVAELAHRATVAGARVAVIVVDIDRFKAINDTFGHATGDLVIKDIGHRLRENLRAFESAYRIGGEEFVVLLDEVDGRRAKHVAERICRAIAGTPIGTVHVTASLGFAATRPNEAFDYEAVFERADAALYAAKRAGGDRTAGDHSPVCAPGASATGTAPALLGYAEEGASGVPPLRARA